MTVTHKNQKSLLASFFYLVFSFVVVFITFSQGYLPIVELVLRRARNSTLPLCLHGFIIIFIIIIIIYKQKAFSYTAHDTKLLDFLIYASVIGEDRGLGGTYFPGKYFTVCTSCRAIGQQGKRREGAIVIEDAFDRRENEQNG